MILVQILEKSFKSTGNYTTLTYDPIYLLNSKKLSTAFFNGIVYLLPLFLLQHLKEKAKTIALSEAIEEHHLKIRELQRLQTEIDRSDIEKKSRWNSLQELKSKREKLLAFYEEAQMEKRHLHAKVFYS